MADAKYATSLNEILASCKFNLPSENDVDTSLESTWQEVDHSRGQNGSTLRNNSHDTNTIHEFGSGPLLSSSTRQGFKYSRPVRYRVKTCDPDDNNVASEYTRGFRRSNVSHARRFTANTDSKQCRITTVVWFVIDCNRNNIIHRIQITSTDIQNKPYLF
uniref:Uncharacterized protein n=1 Tax=Glypta fumiferanae TaxID=389681 RepID=A0A0F6Q738_9HYME|nr:hypothetical protein [Glypta fumiferanae]